MKRFLSSWQGLLAGILGVVLFFNAPELIRIYDPEAGQIDGGFLHKLVCAAVLYLAIIFFGWIGFQISFPSMDKWADRNIGEAFDEMPNHVKFLYTQTGFIVMLLTFILCLIIVF